MNTAEPCPELAHLNTLQLRRIVERHLRWRREALRLLEQVNTGYEGEWPELAEFIRNTTMRPVLADPPSENP